MNYLPSNLEFKDGVAFIGETSLLDVAKEYGTPLYVYDWEHLRDNIDQFTNAFGFTNIMVNIISHIQPVTPISYAMP